MIKSLLAFYKKFRFSLFESDENGSRKIESRRLFVFKLTILVQTIILIVNIVRHLFKKDYPSATTVFVLLCAIVMLFLTKKMSNQMKYLTLLCIGLLFDFIFNHFVNSTKDVIQTYYIVFIGSSFLLKDKSFKFYLTGAVLVYYYSFFSLGYHKTFNPIGVLPFIFISILIRKFISDAEKNEMIIQQQVEELKGLDELKTKLFSNISHEIRTPLTLILGANENLEKYSGVQKYTNSIKTNAVRMLALVNQILDLAKIQDQYKEALVSKLDINVLVQDFVVSFHSLSEVNNITFQTQIDQNLTSVVIDEDAFSKVLVNLLSNAFKFSSSGDQVTLSIDKIDEDYLKMIIKDTGTGIAEEELPYIFNQYYHSNVGLEASSGIGLALVKEIVSFFKGTIKVESQLGVGSVFEVVFPISLQALKSNQIKFVFQENNFKGATEVEPVLDNSSEDIIIINEKITEVEDQKTILLVEDNPELRAYIKEVINEEYLIIEAVDGVEGFEKAIDSIPDVILSDVMMPKMDGLQMLQKLKKDMRTSHIPIVLLTAKSSEEDKLKGLEFEADDYLTKPFNQAELLLRLRNRFKTLEKMQKRLEVFSIKTLKNDTIQSVDDKFLQSIKGHVEKHLLVTEFGPDELAREIGLSKSQVLRKIKALTNVSTSIYMRNIRLEFAKEMLVNKEATISEVAYQTGFSSPNYFSKCFKEYAGVSPKEFLESLE